MIDLTSIGREELLKSQTYAGVERLVQRIITHKQGKKAYLLAKLLRNKLGDLKSPSSPEERGYLYQLAFLDGVSIPLLSEDEIFSLLKKELKPFLEQGFDIGERLRVKFVDLPKENREGFRNGLSELFAQFGDRASISELKKQVSLWEDPDGFFIKHTDGSWERVGAMPPKPVEIPPAPKAAPKAIAPPPPALITLQPEEEKELQKPIKPRTEAVVPQKPKQSPPPLKPPIPILEPAPIKQRVHDIRPPDNLVDPFDEIRTIRKDTLEQHKAGSKEFFEHLEKRLRAFQKGGLQDYTKAIDAWKESPIFKLYCEIANESMLAQKPISAILEKRKSTQKQILSENVIHEISELNRRLRSI